MIASTKKVTSSLKERVACLYMLLSVFANIEIAYTCRVTKQPEGGWCGMQLQKTHFRKPERHDTQIVGVLFKYTCLI